MPNLTEGVIVAIIGFAGVLVGSLISPWLSSKIEFQRERAASRRRVIAEAREYVSGISFGVDNFSKKPFYLSLCHVLDAELKSTIASFASVAHQDPKQARDEIQKLVLLELARIERKWKLI